MTSPAQRKPFPIVGAGPAGLAAAIVLVRAGWQVIVYDRRESPGGRFHDDFQGIENWTARSDIMTELGTAGIEPSFEHVAVRSGTAVDAWGNNYAIRSTDPLYYLVRRGPARETLDQGLLSQAQELGVEVRFDTPVKGIEGPAILAIGPRTADMIAVGYVFETKAADANWICFDESLAPLGYAYLLICGGRGTVATYMFTGFKYQRDYARRTVAFFRKRTGLVMANERPFGGYGNIGLPRTALQGGKLVIGEQAGFQDALAGFGMTYALRSGILAARSLIEGLDYAQLWRRELMPLLKASITNRFLFNLVGERGRGWMLARIASGDANVALRRLYHPWSLTQPLFPIARWRYRAPLRDKSCDHVDCSCVWCEHGQWEGVTSKDETCSEGSRRVSSDGVPQLGAPS